MTPRFLIDENLSVRLVQVARNRGFEAMHVNHLDMRTWRDRDLLRVVERDDWTLVTNNVIEFRGRYGRVELHAGVVFLVPSVRRDDQIELFSAALDGIAGTPDLVNQALDVEFGSGGIVVRRYSLP